VLAIHDSPLYFEISEDDHPWTVTHARDHWWTLDFANAFLSPEAYSRGELVSSHGASRRRLGNKSLKIYMYLFNRGIQMFRRHWLRGCKNIGASARQRHSPYYFQLGVGKLRLKNRSILQVVINFWVLIFWCLYGFSSESKVWKC
jgi:hypothetical protein